MGWYSRFVAKFPYVLILLDVILVAVCGPLAVIFYGLPDFSDPSKGFEPRGTSIHGWQLAARFIHDEVINGTLTSYPVHSGAERVVRSVADVAMATSCAGDSLQGAVRIPRMMVTAIDGSSLLHPELLRAICDIEDAVLRSQWPDHCDAHSLPRYVSALRNKSCEEINTDDVTAVDDLVTRCAGFYFSGDLHEACVDSPVCSAAVPAECHQYDAVYKLLHYLTDSGYMTNGDTSLKHVTYSMVFLREEWYDGDSVALSDFFMAELDGSYVGNELVSVNAMNLLIQENVFDAYVLQDLPWYALAMALVILVLLIYLRSFVLMLAVVLNVMFTISIAYFIYFFVCRMVFFPFMNLLAGLLLIAVGADDVFILYDIWRQSHRQTPEASCEALVTKMLNHGATSVFVTSLTTAAALFANLISDITAIRCFGIFAGISVLVNFILMITWIPAVIVIIHKATKCCIPEGACTGVDRCTGAMANASAVVWGDFFPKVIVGMRYFWMIFFLLLGAGGFVVVFGVPGLSLPTTQAIQVFYGGHPFEVYRDLGGEFRFEVDATSSSARTMEFQILWSVDGRDHGNHFDPDDNGELQLIEFDIFSKESQLWMKSFCHALKGKDFVADHNSSVCYMDLFEALMEGSCHIQSASLGQNLSLAPCCMTSFPVDAGLAELCVSHFAKVSGGHYRHLANGQRVFGEQLFDSIDGSLRIVRYIFSSNRTWTPIYDVIDVIYRDIEGFMRQQISESPAGLSDGWFAGRYGYELSFYDLQRSLSLGTFSGIGLALALGFLVLLATSLNIVITLYAMFTIALVIASTVAVLVLLGWQLNITESLTITLAVGLSIDFTIHYGVAYNLASAADRRTRVKQTLASVGSAVAMAALTTFLSGAAIMPGRVLSYQQFGIFLMLIMTFSWLFSTFFFLPTCAVIGPLGDVGDLTALCRKRWPSRFQRSSGDAVSPSPLNGDFKGVSSSPLNGDFSAVSPSRSRTEFQAVPSSPVKNNFNGVNFTPDNTRRRDMGSPPRHDVTFPYYDRNDMRWEEIPGVSTNPPTSNFILEAVKR